MKKQKRPARPRRLGEGTRCSWPSRPRRSLGLTGALLFSRTYLALTWNTSDLAHLLASSWAHGKVAGLIEGPCQARAPVSPSWKNMPMIAILGQRSKLPGPRLPFRTPAGLRFDGTTADPKRPKSRNQDCRLCFDEAAHPQGGLV